MTRRDLARGAGFLALVFVAAFAGVWAGTAFRDAQAPGPPAPAPATDLVPGTAFPAETVVDAAGEPHDLARLAAGQPEIEGGALAGVRVIGVTSDPAERLADYPAKGARFPVYRDTEGVFGLEHGVTRVPTVVVVGPGGEIRDHWVGIRDDVDFARVRDLASG